MAFLAYFDFLGFKDFIEKTDSDYQKKIIENNFLIIENALGRGKVKEIQDGYIPDLSSVKIHCINFSDTVIFWSQEESVSTLKDLLDVAFTYNWSCICYTFPIRGSIIRGDIFDYNFGYKNENGGTYTINSLFGKGLVNAYLKAADQNWAGTVVDYTIIEFLTKNLGEVDAFLNPYAKKYIVPYKSQKNDVAEWVLKLGQIKDKISDEAFINMKSGIISNFANHGKKTDSEAVQVKIKNTIRFLESFL